MGVRMEHPDLPGQPYDADPLQVPHLRASGWQVAEGQDTSAVEAFPPEAERFDGQPVVRLYHPGLDREIEVAESAVPTHRSSGWQLIEEAEPEPAPPDDLDGLTVADLQDLLRARDLPVSGAKAELIQRLRAAPTEEAEAPAEPAPEEQEA
jgi:SAP domain